MDNRNLLNQYNKKKIVFKTFFITQVTFIVTTIVSFLLMIVVSTLLNQYQNDNINQLQSIENGTFAEKYPDLDPNVFTDQVNLYNTLITSFIIILIVSIIGVIAFSIIKNYYKREKLETVQYEVNDSFE